MREQSANPAEGPATKEPEQSPSLPPGSPSGVVEALLSTLSKVCTYIESKEDMRSYSALTPGKGLHTEVLFHIADLADLRASLPQAHATPAAAPVEGEEVENPDWRRGYLQGLADGKQAHKDFGGIARGLLERLPASPAPGSQGVEGPRKEAREWLDSCQTCKVVFPKGGYHNCPAVREVREGCTVDERTLANCDGRVRIEILGLRQKVESLEADFRRVQANNLKMRDAIEEYEAEAKALRAKLRALEGAARELVAFGHPREGSTKYHAAWEALEKTLAEPHPTKGEEAPAPGVVEVALSEIMHRIEQFKQPGPADARVPVTFQEVYGIAKAALQNQQEKK